MAILLVIPFLAILCVITLVLALKKRWKLAVVTFFVALIINVLTETFPLRFTTMSENDSSEVTVFAYNVHGSGKDYDEKQEDIARLILSESPDVAFLCEFPLYKNFRLDSILTKENGYTQYYQSGTNCVFYSKYAIDSIIGIYSPASNNKYSLNNKVHVFMEHDTLTIVGCHLSSSNHHIQEGYNRRRMEADAIYACIMDEHHPVIVMGDMNDISGSYAIHRIKKAGLEDAWWKGGLGYGTTFHKGGLRLRLDHVLYDKDYLALRHVKVIDSDLSDHNALVVRFDFNRHEDNKP